MAHLIVLRKATSDDLYIRIKCAFIGGDIIWLTHRGLQGNFHAHAAGKIKSDLCVQTQSGVNYHSVRLCTIWIECWWFTVQSDRFGFVDISCGKSQIKESSKCDTYLSILKPCHDLCKNYIWPTGLKLQERYSVIIVATDVTALHGERPSAGTLFTAYTTGQVSSTLLLLSKPLSSFSSIRWKQMDDSIFP